MKNTLLKITVLAGLPALTYLGFFAGVEGARNVIQFFVWAVCLPLGLLALHPRVQEELAKKPESGKITEFFSWVVSLGVLVTLAWFGDVVTAVAWGFYLFCVPVSKKGVEARRAEARP